jgi:hypothetical protein
MAKVGIYLFVEEREDRKVKASPPFPSPIGEGRALIEV